MADVAVNGASCTATANLYKRVNNEITLLASHPEACKDGMSWCVVRSANALWIQSDLGTAYTIVDSDIPTGQPGFGARDMNTAAGNGFGSVALGPPGAVGRPSVSVSAPSNLQFEAGLALPFTHN